MSMNNCICPEHYLRDDTNHIPSCPRFQSFGLGDEMSEVSQEQETPPQTESWRERFDEHLDALKDWMPAEPLEIESSPVSYFGYKHYDGMNVWTIPDWGHIKDFITTVEQEARRDERKKVLEIINRSRRKYLHQVVAVGSQEHLNDTWREGYNDALSDLATKLQEDVIKGV